VGPRDARVALCDRRRVGAIAAGAVIAVLVVGCGGGTRQDSGEASGTFHMALVSASFPASQAVARPARMEIQVRNTSGHAVPNVAVSVDSLNYTNTTSELSANKRPVWAIERGPGVVAKAPVESQEVSQPGGAQTAYVNTWALGPLAAGQTQTFAWQVVPVKAGRYTVKYSIAAGLAGKAKARLGTGGLVAGHFTVTIAPAPPSTHVDPATGKILSGAYPSVP
jgi:hypothetical protein